MLYIDYSFEHLLSVVYMLLLCVTGDEEIAHWKGIFAEMKEKRDRKRFQRGRKRGSQGRGPSHRGPPVSVIYQPAIHSR